MKTKKTKGRVVKAWAVIQLDMTDEMPLAKIFHPGINPAFSMFSEAIFYDKSTAQRYKNSFKVLELEVKLVEIHIK